MLLYIKLKQNKTKNSLDIALTIVVQLLLWPQVEKQQVMTKCAQTYMCFLGTLPHANGMFAHAFICLSDLCF